MTQFKFNTGSELANLVLQSNVPEELWKEIHNDETDTSSSSSSSSSSSRLDRSYENPKWTAIIFSTSRAFADEKLRQGSDLVKSRVPDKSFDLFKFLRGKTDFAINEAAINLFHEHREHLSQLKDQIKANSKPLIITGHSLGGSIASLFTLFLLNNVDFSNKKLPICITFGSPLIGDTNLQKALYKHSPWTSNFLHIASTKDPMPRIFAIDTERDYMPFGTFLLCSESGCTSFEEPETIKTLLVKTAPQGSQDLNQEVDYGSLVVRLKRQAMFKKTADVDWAEGPYQVGIAMQLSAIGGLVLTPQPQAKKLAKEIEKRQMKFQMGKSTVRPEKKLIEMKMNMAKLEWYMKKSKDQEIGYYDSYKESRFVKDIDIQACVKRLIIYWTDSVEEAVNKGETLRDRWLFGGLNYQRMVEPLYIAEHYHHRRDDGTAPSCYEENGRLEHFKRLANLVDKVREKEHQTPIEKKKKRIGTIGINEDSLFWAKVEEAIISCRSMKRGESEDERRDCESNLAFENYVVRLMKNYDVSPEIFFEKSSFMMWWREYREAMGESHESELKDIMESRRYKKYCEGLF